MLEYSDLCAAFKDKALPLAFVDMVAFENNIKAIAQRASSKKVRIATKSIRCVHLTKHILQFNPAVFQGLMCYHPQEAVFLAQQGFDDMLIAYPFTQKQAIEAVANEIINGKKIIVMADLKQHIDNYQQVAQEKNCILSVCLDLDLSVTFPGLHFGVLRSAVKNSENAVELAKYIQQKKHLKLVGLMGYEAQIAGVGDKMNNNYLKNKIVQLLKSISLPKIKQRRTQTIEAIKQLGIELDFVNGGGTGSLETTCQEDFVTEVTVGSGFYQSHLFDYYQSFRHDPAAGFALEITRNPQQNIYTCFGGGYIASGSAGIEKQPLVWLPNEAELTPLEGAGEVQTPIKCPKPLEVGGIVFFRHAKAGELCERFTHLHLIQNYKITQTVPTYRGQNQCFL